MSFTELATKIIKDSIVSTVYIDDNIVEPFEAKSKANSAFYDVSSGLYQSFKKENKSIDFYRFTKGNDLTKDYDYIFKNRDLLILDWHLDDPSSLRQPLTMQLLQEAIFRDNLHFVSIYTQSEAKDFNDIFYSIKAYFETGYTEKIKESFETTFQDIEEKISLNAIEFFNSLSAEFKLIAIDPNNSEIVYEELKKTIQSKLGIAYPIFSNFIKGISPNKDFKKGCEIFGYLLNAEDIGLVEPSDNSLNYKFIGDSFIVINHTIIQITNKKEPSPVNHFNFFTKALLNVCGNLLTLTSLEIRNLLRDSSGFIGKDADSINEAALFHHQSQKENFFDFIINIWKSHTLSFVDYNSEKLATLNKDFWKDYQTKNKISEKIELLKKEGDQFHTELAKLNIYYNSLHLSKTAIDSIKFGDIFIGLDRNGKPNGKYWLNISAHCDCNEPEINLKNNFYFITGQNEPNLEEALSKSEKDFFSYLKSNEQIISIKWFNRPVILNIKDSKMTDFVVKGTDGMQNETALKYISTLKENYTQRMANNSFSFAMRVGIDFATI